MEGSRMTGTNVTLATIVMILLHVAYRQNWQILYEQVPEMDILGSLSLVLIYCSGEAGGVGN